MLAGEQREQARPDDVNRRRPSSSSDRRRNGSSQKTFRLRGGQLPRDTEMPRKLPPSLERGLLKRLFWSTFGLPGLLLVLGLEIFSVGRCKHFNGKSLGISATLPSWNARSPCLKWHISYSRHSDYEEFSKLHFCFLAWKSSRLDTTNISTGNL